MNRLALRLIIAWATLPPRSSPAQAASRPWGLTPRRWPHPGRKAIGDLATKVLWVVWGVWRSGTPYDPIRAGGL